MQLKNRKKIVSDFKSGFITSNAGAMLLSSVESKFNIISKLSSAFSDFRKPERVEHSVEDLLKQRIFALSCGYEDLNDHDALSKDPLFATALRKQDINGKNRKNKRFKGQALASRSSLNRLELTRPNKNKKERYHNISADFEKIEKLPTKIFLENIEPNLKEIIIDFDATDNIIHGEQEHRFYHGYYNNYCYLPLYAFCGNDLLLAKLRKSNIDASKGTKEILEWMIPMIRRKMPESRIVVRGDGGFCRDEIMTWCEKNGVEYILGASRNDRLLKKVEWLLELSRKLYYQTGEKQRIFGQIWYQTKKSWSRERRVIVKAEYSSKGANPRFIVTNYSGINNLTDEIYDKIYCARGDMENRIHEQMSLFSDRNSSSKFHANQLRLWFSAFSYILLNKIREVGLKGTKDHNIRVSTIMLKYLKIGALVTESHRRIHISMSSSYPEKEKYYKILQRMQE
jgi:hypothetical protein